RVYSHTREADVSWVTLKPHVSGLVPFVRDGRTAERDHAHQTRSGSADSQGVMQHLVFNLTGKLRGEADQLLQWLTHLALQLGQAVAGRCTFISSAQAALDQSMDC